MCTAIIYRNKEKNILGLGFNRDESVKRKPSSLPQKIGNGPVYAISPLDGDYGGTWIGVNSSQEIYCLLNFYEATLKLLIQPLQGRILEIGSGTGINFPIYSSKANVIAIEPSNSMMEKAKERIQLLQNSSAHKENAKIRMEVLGLGNPELESLIPEKSVDAVVFTLVLCTVPDPVYAIRFAKSRLKRGGRILILEHVKASSKAGQFLQNILNPFWNRFAQGCNLNRDPASILKAEGFQPLEEYRFRKTLPFYQAIYIFK